MLDLTQKALPNTVTVGGRAFPINTDFRTWLRFEREMKSANREDFTFDASFIFPDEKPSFVPIPELLAFARPQNELPRRMPHQSDEIVLDYDLDSDLIYAAFRECYGIDLFKEDMHWHIFLALLRGISESCRLSKVMGYRVYEKRTDKTDPYEELQRAWRIMPEYTEEEMEQIAELENAFL